VRLQLEGLEERVTPSSLPFATAHNASELQENITFINGNTNQAWSFNLQANTTFNLTAQQELTANANVKIVGLGNDVITPAAGIRAFKVDGGATAEFDNLTISGGKITATDATTNPGGAALWVAGGNVTLRGVSVTNNIVFAATGGPANPQGGGIFVNGAADLTIAANSHIDNNLVLGAKDDDTQVPTVNAQGGGIFVGGGVINISNSTLSNNKAEGGNDNSGSGSGGIAAGGGMFVDTTTTSVLLTNLTVDGNAALGGSGFNGSEAGFGEGGAFFFGGSGPIKLVSSVVTDNKAIGGNSSTDRGADAVGGGLSNDGATATTVLNCSFLSNTAQGGNGATDGGSAFGGAIDLDENGDMNLLNSTLGQNTAQGGNGITGAQGSGFGGGLSLHNEVGGGSIPQLFNNTIVFNQAFNGSGTPVGVPPAPGGGGIWTPAVGADNIASALNNLVQGNTTNGVGPDVNAAGSSIALPLPFNITGGPILQMEPTTTVVNGLPVYPLLPNATLAIKTGTTSVVGAIATAENTTSANATDEVGNPRTTNGGLQIDIGAVQLLTVNAPPPPPPAPPAPPAPPTMSQAVLALFVDAFEIVLSLDGFGPLLHLPSPNALVGSIGANLPFAGSLGIPALMAGVNAANDALSSAGQ
jgi:hypothetical protein